MEKNLLSSQFVTLTAGISVGIIFGWFLRSKIHKTIIRQLKMPKIAAEEEFNDYMLGPQCKLVLVIRNDLKMGKGKAAAQCSHASVLQPFIYSLFFIYSLNINIYILIN